MHLATGSHDRNAKSKARLESWRKPSKRRALTLRARLLLVVAFLCITVSFVLFAWLPLKVKSLTILSLGGQTSDSSESDSAVSEQVSVYSRFCKTLTTASTIPPQVIGSESSDSLVQAIKENRCVLAHVVGLPLVVNEAAFVSQVDRFPASAESLNLNDAIDAARSTDTTLVLAVDLFPNTIERLGQLPEMSSWEFSRTLDRKLAACPDAKVLVVINNAKNKSNLAERLIESFAPEADQNADGTIDVNEWRDHVADPGDDERMVQVYSSVPDSAWAEVALSRCVVAKADKPETAAKKPKGTTKVVASSEAKVVPGPVSSAAPEPKVLSASAPDLATCIALRNDGIKTFGSEQADVVRAKLLELVQADSPMSAASKWLDSEGIQKLRWDELRWMRSIMERSATWSIKQKLIRARLVANHLSLQPRIYQWFGDAWLFTQRQRTNAEQNLLFSVRLNNDRYLDREADTVLASCESIRLDLAALENASETLSKLKEDLSKLVILPVNADIAQHDSVCQLLTAAVKLSEAIESRDKTRVSEIGEISLAVQGLLDQQMVEVERSAPSEMTMMSRLDDSIRRITSSTQIRMQRNLLAVQFLHGSRSNRIQGLAATVKQAETSLNDSKSSLDDYSVAASHFRRSMRQFADLDTTRLGINEDESSLANRLSKVESQLRILCTDAAPQQLSDYQFTLDQIAEVAKQLKWPASTGQRLPKSNVKAYLAGSLALSDQASVKIDLRQCAGQSGVLDIEFDPSVLALVDNPGNGKLNVSHVRAEDRFADANLSRNLSSFTRLAADAPLSIDFKRTADIAKDVAVNVHWITDSGRQIASVPIKMPLLPVVSIGINSDAKSMTLLPNRTASQSIALQSRVVGKVTTDVRLLAWPNPVLAPPPMSLDDADEWLGKQTQPHVLASKANLVLDSAELTPVRFKPMKPDPKQDPISIVSLLCEVKDKERGVFQLIDISPRVFRPAAMVRPSVAYDHQAQMITISAQSLIKEPVDIGVEICNDTQGQRVASGQFTLASGKDVSKRFSTVSATASSVCIRVQPENWPEAFVYEVDLSRSSFDVQLSESAEIQILDSQHEIIRPADCDTVFADVRVSISDEKFRYGEDAITLGLDLNGDRFLDGEPTSAIRTPVAVAFYAGGIDPAGALVIKNVVAPHRISVPIGKPGNRRSQLIASLSQVDHMTWSGPRAVVFDNVAPVIGDVRIASALPAIKGKPVQLVAAIDDAGLSGAGAIKAAWANSGRTEFDAESKIVKGQKLADETWAIILPTGELASGTHQLLVQPIDSAGNEGEIRPVSVEVLTASELKARQDSMASAVIGKVAYVKLPVKQMKVTLAEHAKPKEDAEAAEKSSWPLPKTPPAVFTDAEGKFVIPKVHAGEYDLTIQGLYRGTRRTKVIKIAVKPPTPTLLPTIRID